MNAYELAEAAPMEPRQTAWGALARAWDYVGWPFRPSAHEVRSFEAIVQGWQQLHPQARVNALLLGVTPEIASMDWPEGTRLLGADSSPEVTKAIWPGDIEGRRR